MIKKRIEVGDLCSPFAVHTVWRVTNVEESQQRQNTRMYTVTYQKVLTQYGTTPERIEYRDVRYLSEHTPPHFVYDRFGATHQVDKARRAETDARVKKYNAEMRHKGVLILLSNPTAIIK